MKCLETDLLKKSSLKMQEGKLEDPKKPAEAEMD